MQIGDHLNEIVYRNFKIIIKALVRFSLSTDEKVIQKHSFD